MVYFLILMIWLLHVSSALCLLWCFLIFTSPPTNYSSFCISHSNSCHIKIPEEDPLIGLDNHHDSCPAELSNGPVHSELLTLVQTAIADVHGYSGREQVHGQGKNPHGHGLSRVVAYWFPV